MDRTEPDAAGDDRAVTNAAMSADPEPPGGENPRTPGRNPVADPAGAAAELRASSGGEPIEPDLAELSERDMPSIAAARFEVDVEPEKPTGEEPGAGQPEH